MQVDKYRALLPVIQALRNPAMKERHWHKVFGVIGKELARGDGFTLEVLLEAEVQKFKDEIVQVGVSPLRFIAVRGT